MTTDFLPKFFETLNLNAVQYTVLRNYKLLPESTGGSDLDMLVHANCIKIFDKLLLEFVRENNLNFVSIIDDKQCPKYCISSKNSGLQIDVFKKSVFFGNKEIIPSSVLFANTENYKNIYVLNNKVSVLLAFLKELLNNKNCEQKFIIELQNKFNSLSIDKEFLSQFSPHFLSYLNKNLHVLEKRHLLNLHQLSKKSHKKSKLYNITFKIKRLFKHPGYTIAFIGTDGSGKSTLINKITPILNQAFHNSIFYEHMRPNKLPSIAKLFGKKEEFNKPVTNPHASSSSGLLGSLLRWMYYMLDYTIGFYLKVWPKKAINSCVWVFDRYYYDYLIDPKRGRIKLPRWLLQLGQIFIPEPDLILCLGTNHESIHKRKPELTLIEVERQVLELKKFCDSHNRAVWIDTGKDINSSCYDALDIIINMMSKRFNQKITPNN